jgi:hypothetical protein
MTTYELIKNVICKGENVMPELIELTNDKRDADIVFMRQCIFYFMKRFSNESLGKIGSYLNKDHATVLHSIRTIENYKQTDKMIAIKINLYEEEIKLVTNAVTASKSNSLKIVSDHIIWCIENNIALTLDILQKYNELINAEVFINTQTN